MVRLHFRKISVAIKFRMDCMGKASGQWLGRRLFHSPGESKGGLDKATVTVEIDRAAQ